ncbi:MAG: hypothetical protein AB7I41_03895 [Candidatus Sericytochromatia bacterium]
MSGLNDGDISGQDIEAFKQVVGGLDALPEGDRQALLSNLGDNIRNVMSGSGDSAAVLDTLATYFSKDQVSNQKVNDIIGQGTQVLNDLNPTVLPPESPPSTPAPVAPIATEPDMAQATTEFAEPKQQPTQPLASVSPEWKEFQGAVESVIIAAGKFKVGGTHTEVGATSLNQLLTNARKMVENAQKEGRPLSDKETESLNQTYKDIKDVCVQMKASGALDAKTLSNLETAITAAKVTKTVAVVALEVGATVSGATAVAAGVIAVKSGLEFIDTSYKGGYEFDDIGAGLGKAAIEAATGALGVGAGALGGKIAEKAVSSGLAKKAAKETIEFVAEKTISTLADAAGTVGKKMVDGEIEGVGGVATEIVKQVALEGVLTVGSGIIGATLKEKPGLNGLSKEAAGGLETAMNKGSKGAMETVETLVDLEDINKGKK